MNDWWFPWRYAPPRPAQVLLVEEVRIRWPFLQWPPSWVQRWHQTSCPCCTCTAKQKKRARGWESWWWSPTFWIEWHKSLDGIHCHPTHSSDQPSNPCGPRGRHRPWTDRHPERQMKTVAHSVRQRTWWMRKRQARRPAVPPSQVPKTSHQSYSYAHPLWLTWVITKFSLQHKI